VNGFDTRSADGQGHVGSIRATGSFAAAASRNDANREGDRDPKEAHDGFAVALFGGFDPHDESLEIPAPGN
jgi:hypothetical protein